MNRIARIGFILLGVLLLIALILAVIGVVLVRRPFPQTDGQLTVPGLKGEVHVYRDEYGIPHIYAENKEELYFAQGYVHAQDRFWQMEFWRHIGQGRISEIAGSASIDSDKFIRTMGWNRMAENTLALYEREAPEYITILEAYSAGINAYIAQNHDQLSLNFTVMGLASEQWEIEPWTPLNTITWGVVMADDLSGNWGDEVRRARWNKEIGQAAVDILQPPYPYDTRPTIAPSADLTHLPTNQSQGILPTVDWQRVDTNVLARPENGFALGNGPFVGSNNWVVSGEHTDTGLPLLANDPHLGIQMPSIWYEIGLHAPDLNVVGFSFAGVPGVIIGHNDHIAWGVTNVGPDVQDLFIEKINPNNPRQYEFEGTWHDMEVVNEVIHVNGGEDVTLEVFITRHGPIINEVVDNLSDKLAIQWTAQQPSQVLQAVTLLNQAQNYDDFREALRYWDLPSQNVIYADTEGNIAYQMPGLVPIRKNGNGLEPVPGWTGEYEWEGWIPFEDLPAMLNPEKGYIVTANNAVVDEGYPYLIAIDWADGDRALRITQMIEAAIANEGTITADDFTRIQFDNYSLRAEAFVPLLQNLSSSDSQVQAAIERLRGWDRQMQGDSVPAALFQIFNMLMVHNTLIDDVGADNVSNIHSSIFFYQLVNEPEASWWDNKTTPDITESREDILLKSLTDTVTWFEDNVGGNMNDWSWGRIHTATFVSAPLGQSDIGPIEALVNRGPFPVSGGSTMVNATSWSWSNPAEVTSHPSMRMIVDMSDFDAGRTIMPTGQSGHPFHPHYDDMIVLWQNGQHHTMRFSRGVVEETAVDHLILIPGQ